MIAFFILCNMVTLEILFCSGVLECDKCQLTMEEKKIDL